MRPRQKLLSLVGLAAATLMVAAGCSSATGSPSINVAGASALPSAVMANPSVSAAASIAAKIGATTNKLGVYLVDDKGMTLYVFANDTKDQSNCTGQCATMWPPVTTAPGSSIVGPSIANFVFGTIQRPDGQTQVTYNHLPLYRYSGDSQPGDANGNGFNGLWFVASIIGTAPTPAAGANGAGASAGASAGATAGASAGASGSAGASMGTSPLPSASSGY